MNLLLNNKADLSVAGASKRCGGHCWPLISSVVLLFACGCSGKPAAAISGKATYHGAEIKSGSIRFYPTTKTHGRGAVAPIKDGHYEIPLDRGLLTGTYLVSITADRLSGPKAAAIPKVRGGGENPEPVEYLPAEFNDQTKIELAVEPGDNHQDFNLPNK